MKRFNWITAAAILACSGLAYGQDKPAAPKADASAQPANDTPKLIEKSPEVKKGDRKTDKKAGGLEIGNTAPALSIEKWIKGEPVTGFEKGRVYVVEFWATWCGPCMMSMPHLTELQKEYKAKGLTVIGVASPGWERPQSKGEKQGDKPDDKAVTPLDLVETLVKDKGDTMGYTVAWDKDGATNNAYMKAARQRGIPTAFVVDQKGNIAWFGRPLDIDYVIEDVLGGKWDYKLGPSKIESIIQARQEIGADDGDPKAALKALNEFETKYPKMARAYASDLVRGKYILLLNAEMYPEAYKAGAALVDQAIAKKDFMGLNEIAWGIVDPEGSVKNKKDGLDLAMRAAAKAVEFTKEKDGAILDTLARCYWLQGNKSRAIELQKKAISALTKTQAEDMKEQLEETLKEYEGGKN
jgi:thiol-disulfide isomerase/thioredoxin